MVNKLLTICKKGDDDMTCRRKTKSSRELVADIHKTFTIFCKANECNKCKTTRNKRRYNPDYIYEEDQNNQGDNNNGQEENNQEENENN